MRTTDNIKHFLFEQLEKLQQFAAIGTVVLLVLNLSLSVFGYVQWRDIHPYLGISILAFTIMFLYWSIAHLIVRKGETFKSKARATTKYNPYSVWALSPIQWMLMKHLWFPILKKQSENDKEKDDVVMIERWLDLGYIPKDDFPDDLKSFYITKKEERL